MHFSEFGKGEKLYWLIGSLLFAAIFGALLAWAIPNQGYSGGNLFLLMFLTTFLSSLIFSYFSIFGEYMLLLGLILFGQIRSLGLEEEEDTY